MTDVITETITKYEEYQIQFEVGEDVDTPKDLTGYSALIQIRPYPESETILAEWDQDSPEVTITPLTGMVELNLLPTTTGTFTFKKGVMDILVLSGDGTDGDRSAVVDVIVNSGVSRPV